MEKEVWECLDNMEDDVLRADDKREAAIDTSEEDSSDGK